MIPRPGNRLYGDRITDPRRVAKPLSRVRQRPQDRALEAHAGCPMSALRSLALVCTGESTLWATAADRLRLGARFREVWPTKPRDSCGDRVLCPVRAP